MSGEVDRKRYPYHQPRNQYQDPDEEVYYSDLMVMQSGAGYYIGREGFCVDKKLGSYPESYSRESEYYPTEEATKAALFGGGFMRESGVENEYAKSIGALPEE